MECSVAGRKVPYFQVARAGLKLDGTTLVVKVDDPAWATQLKFLEGTLRTRLREVAGATIERIEVRVGR